MSCVISELLESVLIAKEMPGTVTQPVYCSQDTLSVALRMSVFGI